MYDFSGSICLYAYSNFLHTRSVVYFNNTCIKSACMKFTKSVLILCIFYNLDKIGYLIRSYQVNKKNL